MNEIKNILNITKEALSEKKAENLTIINISNISTIADYFVITNGNNINQVKALADNVQEKLSKAGVHPKSIEGYNNAKWILMDYQDVIINIFSKDERNFYDLERIWRDGKIEK